MAMQNLQTLDRSQLADLLNKETTRYYKLKKDSASKEAQGECKMIIKGIQKEIDQRNKVLH